MLVLVLGDLVCHGVWCGSNCVSIVAIVAIVGSRALSFKRPLLSVDVDVCLYWFASASLANP